MTEDERRDEQRPGPAGQGAPPPPPGAPPGYGQDTAYGAPSGPTEPGATQAPDAGGGAPHPSAPQPSAPQPSAPNPYARGTGAGVNSSAIVLTVVAGISALFTCGLTVPAGVLGVVAMVRSAEQPDEARRFTRWGWIAYGAALVLLLAVLVGVAIWVYAMRGLMSQPYSGY